METFSYKKVCKNMYLYYMFTCYLCTIFVSCFRNMTNKKFEFEQPRLGRDAKFQVFQILCFLNSFF